MTTGGEGDEPSAARLLPLGKAVETKLLRQRAQQARGVGDVLATQGRAARRAAWDEIDVDAEAWTIPPSG